MLTNKANYSFQDAVDRQILDGHAASAAAKLEALDDLFEFCRMVARSRGADGQPTLGANGDLWWSGAHERAWRERAKKMSGKSG